MAMWNDHTINLCPRPPACSRGVLHCNVVANQISGFAFQSNVGVGYTVYFYYGCICFQYRNIIEHRIGFSRISPSIGSFGVMTESNGRRTTIIVCHFDKNDFTAIGNSTINSSFLSTGHKFYPEVFTCGGNFEYGK